MTSIPIPSPGITAMRLLGRSAEVEVFTEISAREKSLSSMLDAQGAWRWRIDLAAPLFLARRLECAFGLGYRDQRWIKLHERLVDGAIHGMAGLAIRVRRHRLGAGPPSGQIKKHPLCCREMGHNL